MASAATDDQDRADMARLAAGHDSALNELMNRHSEPLFHYLLRQLRNEAEAADLAQETFVRVYQHRGRFDARQKFTTWLYTIATNLLRDRFRWHKRHPQVSLDEDLSEGTSLLDTLPEAGDGPDERLAIEERAREVRQAIAELPADWATALILSEYEGMSQAEIGAILNCSAKAVEARLYRARAQLRKRLVFPCLA